jgi:hypothetical protein
MQSSLRPREPCASKYPASEPIRYSPVLAFQIPKLAVATLYGVTGLGIASRSWLDVSFMQMRMSACDRTSLAVSKKSTVLPCLSSARYQYRLAADLDVRLVQSPAFADRADASFALPFTKGFLQYRNQLHDSAVNGGMIDEQAALSHHLFEIAQTQRVGDIPSHAQQHDVQWKSAACSRFSHCP